MDGRAAVCSWMQHAAVLFEKGLHAWVEQKGVGQGVIAFDGAGPPGEKGIRPGLSELRVSREESCDGL